jgi:hypothetical protein
MNVCTFCGNTGRSGAGWILSWGGESHKVHKPCGQKLAEFAPSDASVLLRPSAELKQKWKEERRERDARKFWEEKFALAREKKQDCSSAFKLNGQSS